MSDAEDADHIALKSKQHTMVAEAQAERTSDVTLECGEIARAGACDPEEAVEDADGGGLVEGADIGMGRVEPLDLVRRHLLLNIFRSQPEPGQHVVHRNALPLRESSLPLAQAAAVFVGHGFIVGRRIVQRGRYGIDDGFEQALHGGQLRGQQQVDHRMHVLAGVAHREGSFPKA